MLALILVVTDGHSGQRCLVIARAGHNATIVEYSVALYNNNICLLVDTPTQKWIPHDRFEVPRYLLAQAPWLIPTLTSWLSSSCCLSSSRQRQHQRQLTRVESPTPPPSSLPPQPTRVLPRAPICLLPTHSPNWSPPGVNNKHNTRAPTHSLPSHTTRPLLSGVTYSVNTAHLAIPYKRLQKHLHHLCLIALSMRPPRYCAYPASIN